MLAPNSATADFAAASELDSGTKGKDAFHVLICEKQSSQAQLLSRVVIESGVKPLLSDLSDLTKLQSSRCSVALVGFADCSAANASALNRVRTLANSGLIVMCYANHVRTWP